MLLSPGVPVHRKGRCQESDIPAGFARFRGLQFLRNPGRHCVRWPFEQTRLAMDRRIARTQNALVDALQHAMNDRPWADISVQQLCNSADISRSTFYAHFEGKQELLDLCFERLASELTIRTARRGLDEFGNLSYLPNLLTHIKTHCELFRLNATSAAGQQIFSRFKALVVRLGDREFAECRMLSVSVDQRIFIHGGIFAMLEAWNANNCRDSEKTLLRRIDKLVANNLDG